MTATKSLISSARTTTTRRLYARRVSFRCRWEASSSMKNLPRTFVMNNMLAMMRRIRPSRSGLRIYFLSRARPISTSLISSSAARIAQKKSHWTTVFTVAICNKQGRHYRPTSPFSSTSRNQKKLNSETLRKKFILYHHRLLGRSNLWLVCTPRNSHQLIRRKNCRVVRANSLGLPHLSRACKERDDLRTRSVPLWKLVYMILSIFR